MDQWYVARGKVKEGPYARVQLQSLVGSGALRVSDMLLQVGTQRWIEARDVPGLFPETRSVPVLAIPVALPAAGVAPVPVFAQPVVPRPVASIGLADALLRRPWLWAGGVIGLCVLLGAVVILGGRSDGPRSGDAVAQSGGQLPPSGQAPAQPSDPTAKPSALPVPRPDPASPSLPAEKPSLLPVPRPDPPQASDPVEKPSPPLPRPDPAQDSAASADGTFFNGKDLTGWEGLPGYWKVRDGALVGAPANGVKAHTFLCSRHTYADFELKFKVRREGGVGNSGVQFRSTLASRTRFTVVGPQLEIDSATHPFPPGSVLTEPTANPHVKANAAALARVWKDADFNEMTLRCVGKHVTVTVNGVVAVDVAFRSMPAEGITAWQLHGGYGRILAPEEVVFKDIHFKDLGRTTQPDKVASALDKESEKLAGTWGVTSVEDAGRIWPADQIKPVRFVIADTRFMASLGLFTLMKGTFTLDPTKTPKTIDLTSTAGKHQGKTMEGIYEATGDTLRICFAQPDGERPKDFTATADNKAFLLVCERTEQSPAPKVGGGPALEPGSAELLVKGSVWRGTSLQVRPIPTPPQRIEVVVAERNGDHFKAELRWNGRHLRDIEGDVAGGKIKWNGAAGERNRGHFNVGAINGKRIEVKYYRTLDSTLEDGTLRLELVTQDRK